MFREGVWAVFKAEEGGQEVRSRPHPCLHHPALFPSLRGWGSDRLQAAAEGVRVRSRSHMTCPQRPLPGFLLQEKGVGD